MLKLVRLKLLCSANPDHTVFAVSASEAIKNSPSLAVVHVAHACRALHCEMSKCRSNAQMLDIYACISLLRILCVTCKSVCVCVRMRGLGVHQRWKISVLVQLPLLAAAFET